MTQLALKANDLEAGDADMIVALDAGRLTVSVDTGVAPLETLCGFGSRRNARRGFLFVSRVLGRYIPVAPRTFRWAAGLLARQLPPDLPGPILMVGIAEAGAGLGHGVHAAYRAATGRTDVVYVASTRYLSKCEHMVRFDEPHSHASRHHLYWPSDAAVRAECMAARTVVIVDDECSTGTTFRNLAAALRSRLLHLETVRGAVLTQWWTDAPTMPIHALLSGRYCWSPAGKAVPAGAPSAVGCDSPRDDLFCQGLGGRSGSSAPPTISRELVDRWADHFAGRSVLVLGTGEFIYPAFLVAEALEQRGLVVTFQTTTRAPVSVGHDIRSVLSFGDNYSDGIPNYLYNADHGTQDRVLIVHETPPETIDPGLVDRLAADLLDLGLRDRGATVRAQGL